MVRIPFVFEVRRAGLGRCAGEEDVPSLVEASLARTSERGFAVENEVEPLVAGEEVRTLCPAYDVLGPARSSSSCRAFIARTPAVAATVTSGSRKR